jgi:hypothetical protein
MRCRRDVAVSWAPQQKRGCFVGFADLLKRRGALSQDEVEDLVDNVFNRYSSGPPIEEAATRLRKHSSAAVESLISAAADPKRKLPAMRALGFLGIQDDRAIDFLAEGLRAEGDERRIALVALYRIGGEKSNAILKPLFEESQTWPDRAVQSLATWPTRPGRARRWGESLNALGGFGLMLAVHEQVAEARPDYARPLEIEWDGIGLWLG